MVTRAQYKQYTDFTDNQFRTENGYYDTYLLQDQHYIFDKFIPGLGK